MSSILLASTNTTNQISPVLQKDESNCQKTGNILCTSGNNKSAMQEIIQKGLSEETSGQENSLFGIGANNTFSNTVSSSSLNGENNTTLASSEELNQQSIVDNVEETVANLNSLIHSIASNLNQSQLADISEGDVIAENQQGDTNDVNNSMDSSVLSICCPPVDMIVTQPHIEGEFHIGDEFSSLDDIEENLRIYEEKNDVKMYKRDVRTLESCIKRSQRLQTLASTNEKLKYGQLLYCCVYGGKKRYPKGTYKTGSPAEFDCKMCIRFNISVDGMKLVVTKINEKHCHDMVVLMEAERSSVGILNKGNATELKLGAAFTDISALYDVVQQYERDNHIHLWKRDGRTVQALAKRSPGVAKKIMEKNPGIRFAELRYCCSFGGRNSSDESKLKTDGIGKLGCGMHIRFGISGDGSQLVVKSMSEEHNHEINQDSILKEALHPELCTRISKLVWKDVRISTEEVKNQLEYYVTKKMFIGEEPPLKTRRQYYPTKKQIRYFMAKARAALEISSEIEEGLTGLEEKLKNFHNDENMIFNSLVKEKEDNFHIKTAIETSDGNASFRELTTEEHIIFCHQTPYQQRLLKRYGSQVILTEINDIHPKIPFPLFCLYVQTNVDCQLVGEFIIQASNQTLIASCLSMFKQWNSGWTPKFIVVDYNEDQLSATEQVFPGCFVLISSMSREKEWNDWLDCNEQNPEHKQEILTYLEAIADSYSEETLNEAAKCLEESEIWKTSDKLRNWFQSRWLAHAKRWVIGYRPDDFFSGHHNSRTLSDELKTMNNTRFSGKTFPIIELISDIVQYIVPQAKKQYIDLNQQSAVLQKELFYGDSSVPLYLSTLPGHVSKHIYVRIVYANNMDLTVRSVHPGVFSVGGGNNGNEVHSVSFGDHASYPSCECSDWQEYKLPCVHFAAIFNVCQDWGWDMMSSVYRSNAVLNLDWSALLPKFCFTPQLRRDQYTQYSVSSSQSSHTTLNKRLLKKTATKTTIFACRSLLNQIENVQLSGNSCEKLHRIKSELDEIARVSSKIVTTTSSPVNANIKEIRVGNRNPMKRKVSNICEDQNSIVVKRRKGTPFKLMKDSIARQQDAVVSTSSSEAVEISENLPIQIILEERQASKT